MENGFLNKDRILAKELASDAYKYLVDMYDRSNVQQLTPSSPFIQILNVVSELTELILQYNENSISELNFATAKNSTNIFGLSRLTGHNPTRGVSPKGIVNISLKVNAEFDGDYVLIPKYSKIKCLNNNLIYLLFFEDDYIKIEKNGVRSQTCNILEGTVEIQQIPSNGGPMQSYSIITNSLTDHFNVKVNVNGETYTQYESVYDMPANEKGYSLYTGINGGLDLYFGTGEFGNTPEQGSLIEITYIKTNGDLANIPSRTTKVAYEFDDIGTNIFGEEIDLKDIFNISSIMNPTFGADEEDSNFTKLIAPYMSKSFVLLNPDNYYHYLKRYNYFSVINIYNTIEDRYKDDDNIIYMFLVPDLRKKLTSEYDYFSFNEEEFKLTQHEKNMIRRLLNESGRQAVGTEVKFVEPQIKRYVLNLVISYYENQNMDALKIEINRKLNEYFINVSRRDIIPRSDIIAVLKSIDGIDSANAFFISEENETAINQGFYTKRLFAYDPIKKRREWIDTKQITLSENQDPNLGLNEFGDILIGENEVPIIKGGWTDSNNIYYEEDLTSNLSGLNVFFKDSIRYNTYIKENKQNLKNILI